MDREIGYYCMSCGQQFSTEEIAMLLEKAARTSRPICRSGKSEEKPSVEIKELPPPKGKESERAGREVTKRDKPERI